jgi:hypothetical protein
MRRRNPQFSVTKMEITTRKFTVLVVPLIAALTAQAAAASEHHTRTKGRAAVSAQWRNSIAYATPGDIAARSNSPRYTHYNGGQMLMPGAY